MAQLASNLADSRIRRILRNARDNQHDIGYPHGRGRVLKARCLGCSAAFTYNLDTDTAEVWAELGHTCPEPLCAVFYVHSEHELERLTDWMGRAGADERMAEEIAAGAHLIGGGPECFRVLTKQEYHALPQP